MEETEENQQALVHRPWLAAAQVPQAAVTLVGAEEMGPLDTDLEYLPRMADRVTTALLHCRVVLEEPAVKDTEQAVAVAAEPENLILVQLQMAAAEEQVPKA